MGVDMYGNMGLGLDRYGTMGVDRYGLWELTCMGKWGWGLTGMDYGG